ncbi:MAG TPA: hypothetical protein VET27_24255 [Mycobacterium sp.]|nr:hypothetical protein [Mycobacterium sp.]
MTARRGMVRPVAVRVAPSEMDTAAVGMHSRGKCSRLPGRVVYV